MTMVRMAANRTKQALRKGQEAVGIQLTSSSSLMAEVLALQGFDFVLVDLQHSESSINDIQRLVHAITAGGGVPMVRVPGHDPALMQRCLDLGVYGLIVPLVNTVDDARAAVQATKYPPLGERSWGPVRGAYYGVSDYFQRANEETLLVAQLETREAAENADRILALEGIDGCVIGPNDLAMSYGYPPRLPENPSVVEEGVQQILAAAGAAGKFAGMFCGNSEAVNRRIKQGMRFFVAASDVWLALAATSAMLSSIQRSKGAES